MALQHPTWCSGGTVVPLRKWIEDEAKERFEFSGLQIAGFDGKHTKETVLRKTTIAYGVAELLRHARAHPVELASHLPFCEQCKIDNFVVYISAEAETSCPLSQLTWSDIKGVGMLSLKLAVNLLEPSFLRSGFTDDGDDKEDQMGRYLEAEFSTLVAVDGLSTSAFSQSEEDTCCHSLGALLYELFSQSQVHLSPVGVAGHNGGNIPANGTLTIPGEEQEPELKKKRPLDLEGQIETGNFHLVTPGFPSSTRLLVQNLLDCGENNRPENAYDSLDEVIKDLHLLLLDPRCFLFDRDESLESDRSQLQFKEHKMYGREDEVSLITDAFCRVSSGQCEAFFIGGFSGSGKSMLVNSLTARVDIAGGYVLTHKFDQMSKESPLWQVIGVFNELCLLIHEKRSGQDLKAIVNNLIDIFATDLPMLARLLPNLATLSPQLNLAPIERGSDVKPNMRSICFILQRFTRVVSSKAHPVMLFLDDLQWCDSSALTLIKGIVSDAPGSSCLFFVGSYRNNEVQVDHAIFRLMDSLSSAGVRTTKLSLEGLHQKYLNSMISDAMGVFPRICASLSGIVFQKTKGNPFFAVEFLRSLLDRGLLEWSIRKRRWVWDENRINAMDITGNALHLLFTKMSGLSETIQVILKVAACFGIEMKGSIVGLLSKHPEYSKICDVLEQAVREGFMMKVGYSDFKFVHDKVREAAYSLIPEGEKNQCHYSLGMLLYSATKGRDVGDIVFCIVDQINYGIGSSFVQSPELRVELAYLNEMAGVKAIDCLDFASAIFYLNVALSLLPADQWNSHYELSLRLTFLLAKSTYSCGHVEEANNFLQEILLQARSLSDKLDAYYLVIMILHTKETIEEAYKTTCEVLLQLGETIPDVFGQEETNEVIKVTFEMLNGITEESLLGMKTMEWEDEYVLKFYSLIALASSVSFFQKRSLSAFFACRIIQLSMQKGMCKYSFIGFALFAARTCTHSTMPALLKEAGRIGKLTVSALKRYNSVTDQLPRVFFLYYSYVAVYSEPLHSCANNLRRGFECGIASGDISSAFILATNHIRVSFNAGTELPTLIKRMEYYVEAAKTYSNVRAESYLMLFRESLLVLEGKESKDYSVVQENAVKFPPDLTNYHKFFRAYWVGHFERGHHYLQTLVQGNNAGGEDRNSFMFYYGLNSLKVIRRGSPKQLKAVPYKCLRTLKDSEESSPWNVRNKVHLLEAEIFSFEGESVAAKASYAAAISSAHSSRFIHEQGLACELAGFHYKKIGENENAHNFFNRAKQCYAEWGSQMKVESMMRQGGLIQDLLS